MTLQSKALEREQSQLREDLADMRRRMLELGRTLAAGSAARMGWFERASVVDDLVASIPSDSQPVGELAWRVVARDDV